MSRPLDITVTDEPGREDVQGLDDRLHEFNAAATGFADGRLLAVLARDETGAVVGGLHGWTWGGTCEIRTLWVDARRRRQGLGSRLLALAEEEARRRGARQIVLGTHSFQAPEFYRRFGFEAVGSIGDHPLGHSHVWLRKRLV